MTSRRHVLQFGLAGAALLPVATYARAWPDASDDVALYKLIVDERFPESLALARRRYGPSAPLTIIRGDVTSLWYEDLYFAWQRGPAPISGVTTSQSLFCLEMLARDAGMDVVRRQDITTDLVSWSIGVRRRAR